MVSQTHEKQMKIEKQYARRSLVDFEHLREDPFRYKSLTELGDQAFIFALKEVNQKLISRDVDPLNPEKEFYDLVKFAGASFNPLYWEVAYLDSEIAGVVCPQRYDDKPNEGSIFYFGLIPRCRGKGFGKVLHARGLSRLKAQGVTEYVGSTDIQNHAMIRTFINNNCRLTKIKT